MTAAPTTEPIVTDLLLSAAIENEARKVMAERCALKRQPGTHGQQAAMLVPIDELLDQWLVLGL